MRLTGGDDLTEIQHRQIVAKLHHYTDLVLDQQDRAGQRVMDRGDLFLQLGGFGFIHPGQRFIQ